LELLKLRTLQEFNEVNILDLQEKLKAEKDERNKFDALLLGYKKLIADAENEVKDLKK